MKNGVGQKVRVVYYADTKCGFRRTRRVLRENNKGLFVYIGGIKCYVEPHKMRDTGRITHYVSKWFDYSRGGNGDVTRRQGAGNR